MDMKWYVLYVESGRETDVQKKLSEQGFEAVVPIENRMIRHGGRWISRPYVVFPGYVFIRIAYNWMIYYTIAQIPGVIKLLGGGKDPEALTEQEAELIVRNAKLFREPPLIRLHPEGYEILNDKFDSFRVVRLDRHARRITFTTTVSGKETEFTLSFIKA